MARSESRFPRRRLAILTCMDCRVDPLAAAGIGVGEAHVIRNAGAVVTADVRRSLAISQRALRTDEVWIVKHSDCGLLGLDDREFLDRIEEETGVRPDWEPGGFAALDAGVREEIGRIEADPALVASKLRGFILDVETGAMTEVQPA